MEYGCKQHNREWAICKNANSTVSASSDPLGTIKAENCDSLERQNLKYTKTYEAPLECNVYCKNNDLQQKKKKDKGMLEKKEISN